MANSDVEDLQAEVLRLQEQLAVYEQVACCIPCTCSGTLLLGL